MRKLFVDLIVTLDDETANFTGECMVEGVFSSATVTLIWKVEWREAITEPKCIPKFKATKLCTTNL